jgi:hypothetical protein
VRAARAAGFAALSAGAIGLTGVVLGAVFRGVAGRHAVVVSAGVAIVVQVAAFAVADRLRGWNVVAGWALGMVLRFLAVGVYGLAVVRALGLAPTAALLSLAIFLFVSTLIEPWFLRA